MFIGKVTGNLVSTIKIKEHEGKKLMLVQKADAKGKIFGPVYVAIDMFGAGIGDYVLFTAEGGAAGMLSDGATANCAIAGVLDNLPILIQA